MGGPNLHLPVIQERALSKSQLEAWKSCQRKWGWPYLEGVRGSNQFADFGTRVHSQLERWLGQGILPDPNLPEGIVAESGLQHLPAPGTPGLLVETEVYTITEQAIYHGFGDWIEPPGAAGVPTIGDHKSTVDFKWALTPEKLERDIQANIYARAAMDYFGTDEAAAKWVYYRTRGAARSHPVERVLRRETVEQVFAEDIDPVAAEIQQAWEERPRVLDLEPNVRACSDYGGCPYRDRCSLTARDVMKGRFAHMGLLDKLKKGAQTSTPSTPQDTEPKGKVNPPESEKVEGKGAPNPKPTGSLASKMQAGAAKKAAEAAPEAKPTETPAETPKVKETARRVKTEPSRFTLLVGCFPIQLDRGISAVAQASDLIAAAKALVEQETGVVDYRLVDFGKGPGMLAAAVRQALLDNPPDPSTFVFLDLRTDEGRHCYEAFREVAGTVIRAL